MLRAWVKREIRENTILFKSIPPVIVTLFVISIVCMNLLANKTLFQNQWIALDGGILLSWLSFMCMDIITKHFGPRASNKIAIFGIIINLFVCFIFYLSSIIPSNADDYTAFDQIFGGTWFILLGSTVAFFLSAFANNFLNCGIMKCFKGNEDSKLSYAVSTYVSTFIGQFLDNLVFSIIVFYFFAPIFWDGFQWSIIQCIMCALTGAIAELIMEVVFSPFGYKILCKWRRDSVGKEYIDYVKEIK